MTEVDRTLADAAWLRTSSPRRIMELLCQDGGSARFVGGCVRDALAKRAVSQVDLDIATTLLPEQVIERLEAVAIRVVPTGLDHGTVTAFIGASKFEITTLRLDKVCDGRHAEVAFTDSYELDAARRDFTINAMSCDPEGRVFDPFGGLADLSHCRVRFVGAANERIQEDYLRILRFFRFYAGYGTEPPDAAAMAACSALKSGLDTISGERIWSEMSRILTDPGAGRALLAMKDAGVLAEVIGQEVDIERLKCLIEIAPQSGVILRLAALLRGHSEGDGVRAGWRLSNRQCCDLQQYCRADLPAPGDDRTVHLHGLYQFGHEVYFGLALLAAAERRDAGTVGLSPISQLDVPVFPISGKDVLARGVDSGVKVGDYLELVRSWWVAEDFRPDRRACLVHLDRVIAGENSN